MTAFLNFSTFGLSHYYTMQSRSGIFILIVCVLLTNKGRSQCTATISSFPYQESFESGTANWVSGGINNDWAWGAPAKPLITGAGSGTKCWITGGLTASFYNFGERSWVESPCFDFTAIDHPYISFLIFWETERTYDGGNLQYTLDGGATWRNVGSVNDPVQCNDNNWFNINNVTNLSSFVSNTQGWSGTIQPSAGSCNGGGGSAAWKRATHCIPSLAHKPLVKFRFTFASGTTCNDYDGIAFDDFYIGPAPSISNDFLYSCITGSQLHFNDLVTDCFDHWEWNFGDPSSPDNLKSGNSVNHEFSSGGLFSVTLTTGGSCAYDTQIVKLVKVLDVESFTTPVSCIGDSNGIAQVMVSNPGPGLSYSWSHDPLLVNSIATSLHTGYYVVTVTEPGACAYDIGITIDNGPDSDPLISLGNDTVFCPGSEFFITPGSFATYLWQDYSTDSFHIVNHEGKYAVRVVNASGCATGDTIEVAFDCLQDVIFPNAFTPNGDGVNELFTIGGSEVTAFRLYVFNRWGEMIFSSEDQAEGWDGSSKGQPVQEGFYNFLLNYSIGNAERSKTGSIYLYR